MFTSEDFQRLGLSLDRALDLSHQIKALLKNNSKTDCWKILNKAVYPFAVLEYLYHNFFPDWDIKPQPAVFPNIEVVQKANLTQLMKEKGIETPSAFHQWSCKHYSDFWQSLITRLEIVLDKPFTQLVDLSKGLEKPQWLVGAQLNISNSCFTAKPDALAIISETETGIRTEMTYEALNHLSNRVANGILAHFKSKDALAIIMPMTISSIALYLGILKAGCVAVSIAESFAAEEIEIRCKIANVKGIFTQHSLVRNKKHLPLYDKILKTNPEKVIVLEEEGKTKSSFVLRPMDLHWETFLERKESFQTVSCDPEEAINILFSSGTTGEPKAIPWTHTTPIKCATDAYLNHNLKPHDIFCWPTSLGWMMGPWLIFACLINRATIALYEGTPNGRDFGLFIQNAKVTVLGVVPTLVKTWRHTRCMEGLNWRALKLFSSTGECSNVSDMLYLMHLANFPPIIEYCGGTEIGGAYISSTVLEPNAPGAFSLPAFGLDFLILNEAGEPDTEGVVALIPPSIGLSTTLLNKDHHAVYFQGMPNRTQYPILRQHGDQITHYSNGYYRLQGRADDTMNLGGIKVSAAEIERVLARHERIFEVAAITKEPKGGGPSALVIVAVLKPNTQKTLSKTALQTELQELLKESLSPLFKIQQMIIQDALPRTASNKVMRRVLRDMIPLSK